MNLYPLILSGFPVSAKTSWAGGDQESDHQERGRGGARAVNHSE